MPEGTSRGRSQVEGLPVEKVAIDFVVLGDYAQATGGKLTLVGGGWNILNPPQYPFALPFGIGIGFLIPWNETNRKHAFQFVIRQSEGEELASGRGDLEIGRPTGIPEGMTQRVVAAVSGQLRVPGPGTYEIIVSVENDRRVVTFEAKTVGR